MYWIIQMLIRGGVPFAVMALIAGLLKYNENSKKSKEVFIVGLIWLFIGVASLIYEIPNWSMPQKIIVHFIGMLLTVYPCLLISGWFKLNNLIDALKILGVFLAIGAIIILGFGIYYYLQGKS